MWNAEKCSAVLVSVWFHWLCQSRKFKFDIGIISKTHYSYEQCDYFKLPKNVKKEEKTIICQFKVTYNFYEK